MTNLEEHQAPLTKRLRSLFSDSSLTKKATLNAIAAGLEYAARLIVGLLITPVLVGGLGDYFYGAYQVLTRLLSYLNPATGRPTQALKMKLANQQLIAEEDDKRRFVGSTMVVLLLFLPLLIVAGGIISWFSPIWLKATPETYTLIRITASILVLQLIVSNFGNVPRSTLEGVNLGYKRMGLSTILIFVGAGFTWLAIKLGTGLVGVAVAHLVSVIISGVFYLLVVKNYAPWFGIKKPSREENREFFGLSIWFMLWNLVNTFMMASDVVVLGLLNSVQSVTNYTLTKYAPETVINVIAMTVFSILPGLGGIIGSGDFVKAAKVRSEIMSFAWWILTVFGATTLLWNQKFLTLWVGSEHYPGGYINFLVVLMVSQFVILRNDANVIDLTLQIRQKVLLGLVSVSISVGLAILFVAGLKMGVPGAIFGIMAGRVVLSIAYPLMVGRLIKISWQQQVKSILRPLTVTAALFLGFLFVSEKISTWDSIFTNTWIGLLLTLGFTFICLLILTFLIGFNGEQKTRIRRRLAAIGIPGMVKETK